MANGMITEGGGGDTVEGNNIYHGSHKTTRMDGGGSGSLYCIHERVE